VRGAPRRIDGCTVSIRQAARGSRELCQ